jgi:predicted membrane-bound spermidine synthase
MRLPAFLLFLSGMAALVYQMVWVRQLTLVVGVDVYAVTTGVAAFFAGLALGSAAFGRIADRSERPVRIYVILEVGVAVLGIVATALMARAPAVFVSLQDAVGPAAWLLPLLIVGVPAFLMGGTLPVLVRAVEPDEEHVGAASGSLYAWNTGGAILGALLVPFALAPAFGLKGAAIFAVVLNLVAAGMAWTVDHRREIPEFESDEPEERSDRRLALAIYAFAGALALGYEIVWSQLLVQFLSTRAFAFAIVLATYLTGLVVGSAIHSRFADHVKNHWLVFGALISGAGLSALLIFASIGTWLPDLQTSVAGALTGAGELAMYARFAVAALVVLFVPTVFLGAAFPAAVRLTSHADRIGRGVGSVAAWNTLGGIAGTFLVGFVLIPWLGVSRTLGMLAVLATLLGALAAFRGAPRRLALSGIIAAAVVTTGAALLLPSDKLATLLAEERGGEVVFYEEGAGGAVAVLAQDSLKGTFRRLYISGVSNSGDSFPSLRYMRLQALLPLVIHNGEPKSAMVIALGTGITCGSLLADPSLERRVCVELLPEVVRAAALFDGNFDVTNDERVTIDVADGRHHLLRHDDRYDLITLEPPPPSAAGVANLYSREFYELARDRLNENGLVAQWWPLATQNDEDSRSIVRAMLEVFPHLSVWTTEIHEMLLVGSMEPLELDAQRISRRFEEPSIASALAEVGVKSPAALVATWVTGRDELERYAGAAPPVTDDHPVIEYARWVREDELERVLPRILEERTEPPVANADMPFLLELKTERGRLLTFYEGTLLALGGNREGWRRTMNAVIREEADNPYYNWILGR